MLLIIVHTRDASYKLTRILRSIKKYVAPRYSVLIVDDSCTARNNNTNAAIAAKYDARIVNRQIWQNFKAQLIALPRMHKYKPVIERMQLGTSNWNTGNARNVGLILASMMPDKKNILFFDDDIILESALNLRRFKNVEVAGFRLRGCPDLSRLEWIQLFLRHRRPSSGGSQNTYVAKLISSLSCSDIESMIKQSTLFSKFNALSKMSPKKYLDFPYREEYSGGAFVISRELLPVSLFPNWFDEDWFWFNKIRNGNSPGVFMNYTVIHASDKKKILCEKRLFEEEFGKICDYVYKNSVNINAAAIKKGVTYRKKVLSLVKQQLLYNDNSGAVNEIKKFLKKIEVVLNAMSSSKIIEQMKEFNILNNLWPGLCRELNSIRLLAPNKICIVSPHSDDAFFSLGCYLSQSHLKKQVIVPFSISKYSVTKAHTIEQNTKIRKKEDARMGKLVDAKIVHLNYKDAPLRGYSNYMDRGLEINESEVKELYYKLLPYAGCPDTVCLFPTGNCNHIDHKIINHLGSRFKNSLYYDDAYQSTLDESISPTAGKKHQCLVPVILRCKAYSHKAKLSKKLYPSQVDADQFKIIDKIARKYEGERVWKNIDEAILL